MKTTNRDSNRNFIITYERGDILVDYIDLINQFTDYFKRHEKKEEEFKLGIEVEHFVVDKDSLRTISYYGKDGVAETLKELENNGWVGSYEGENILGVNTDTKYVTLEPGSQLELSIAPQESIEALEKEYLDFIHEIVPILEKKNQALVAVGYHPISKIEDIRMIPKKRYDYMYEYFKSKGLYAHNMMKGTASFQVAIDYSSEEDYIKKFKVASALSPVLYSIFDSGYYFEGRTWDRYSLRSVIWENCDKARSGIVPGVFDDDFGYRKYAEYILNVPPIFIYDGKTTYPTGEKLVREIFEDRLLSTEELEHVLTMVFPDVRTKKYIEIRMMDAIPYPLNFAALALIKGIMYNKDNLNTMYQYVKDLKEEDIEEAKRSIVERGLEGKVREIKILEIGESLLDLAKKGLKIKELKYLEPLESLLKEKKNPYQLIKEKDSLGRKESLNWCMLNNILINMSKL